MAADWIKLREDLKDDFAVARMARDLGIDRWSVVGRLSDIWAWVGRQTADGQGLPLDSAMIDERVACAGFAKAMQSVNWLLGEEGAFIFPKWDRHNSNSAKARALETEAKRIRRSTPSAPPSPGSLMSDSVSDICPTPRTAVVRLEKRREDIEDTLSTRVAPVAVVDAPEPGDPVTQPPVVNPQITPPTLEQVKAIAANRGIPPDCAESFFNSMMATGWVDGQNRPIRNWTFSLAKYGTSWRANDFQRGQRNGSPQSGPSKPMKPRRPPRPGQTSTLFPEGAPAGVTVGKW